MCRRFFVQLNACRNACRVFYSIGQLCDSNDVNCKIPNILQLIWFTNSRRLRSSKEQTIKHTSYLLLYDERVHYFASDYMCVHVCPSTEYLSQMYSTNNMGFSEHFYPEIFIIPRYGYGNEKRKWGSQRDRKIERESGPVHVHLFGIIENPF